MTFPSYPGDPAEADRKQAEAEAIDRQLQRYDDLWVIATDKGGLTAYELAELDQLEKFLFCDRQAVSNYRRLQLDADQRKELEELNKLAAEVETARYKIAYRAKLAEKAANVAIAMAMLAVLSSAAWLPPLLHKLWPGAWAL